MVRKYIVYWSLHFSAWIIVSITWERVLVIYFPVKAKGWITKQKVAATICTIGLVLAAVNIHLLTTYNFYYDSERNGVCDIINPKYSLHMWDKVYFKWVDVCLACFFPFALLLIGNMCIIVQLAYARREAKAMMNVQHDHIQMKSVTPLLLTITFMFMLTTGPISVYILIEVVLRLSGRAEGKGFYTQTDYIWPVVNMVCYINNALNFYLYCLSGQRFRKDLLELFRGKSQMPNTFSQPSTKPDSIH